MTLRCSRKNMHLPRQEAMIGHLIIILYYVTLAVLVWRQYRLVHRQPIPLYRTEVVSTEVSTDVPPAKYHVDCRPLIGYLVHASIRFEMDMSQLANETGWIGLNETVYGTPDLEANDRGWKIAFRNASVDFFYFGACLFRYPLPTHDIYECVLTMDTDRISFTLERGKQFVSGYSFHVPDLPTMGSVARNVYVVEHVAGGLFRNLEIYRKEERVVYQEDDSVSVSNPPSAQTSETGSAMGASQTFAEAIFDIHRAYSESDIESCPYCESDTDHQPDTVADADHQPDTDAEDRYDAVAPIRQSSFSCSKGRQPFFFFPDSQAGFHDDGHETASDGDDRNDGNDRNDGDARDASVGMDGDSRPRATKRTMKLLEDGTMECTYLLQPRNLCFQQAYQCPESASWLLQINLEKGHSPFVVSLHQDESMVSFRFSTAFVETDYHAKEELIERTMRVFRLPPSLVAYRIVISFYQNQWTIQEVLTGQKVVVPGLGLDWDQMCVDAENVHIHDVRVGFFISKDS